MPKQLSSQARAAEAVLMLYERGAVTTGEIAEATGLTGRGARRLMGVVSVIPIYQPVKGIWALMDEDLGDPISVRQAAAELGIHHEQLYQRVRDGELPGRRIGSRYVLDRDEIFDDF